MVQNTLDGSLLSPFSNITSARFGIPWGVKVELDTEGIQEFTTVFTNVNVTFVVRSDLPTPGTFLYDITFENGVVVDEGWNFSPFGPADPSEFRMNGKYDPATSTFSFQAPNGTLIETGAKFWLNVSFGGIFPTRSNIALNEIQHPFQFTEAGATNGFQKTIHLFEKPETDLTIKVPYFERSGLRIAEVFTFEDQDWVAAGIFIIGRRVSDQIRASQKFEMLSRWFAGDFAGTVTTQTAVSTLDISWGLDESVYIAENPQCDGAQSPFVNPVGVQSGDITYGDVTSDPTDSGDGLRVTFPATPSVITQHRVQQLLSSAQSGSGTAACSALVSPPGGDILATTAFRARCRALVPPAPLNWGFDRWLEE